MKGKKQDELIRIEAYLLSEKAGHPTGMDHHFWTQAEAIVRQRAVATKTGRGAGKKTAKTRGSVRRKPAAAPARKVVAPAPPVAPPPKTAASKKSAPAKGTAAPKKAAAKPK